MDKSIGRDKRRKDKHHKKPPVKSNGDKSASKPQKELDTRTIQTSSSIVDNDDFFSKRPIESNWERSRNISSGESDSEDEQLRAADFEKLLQMPSSVSGHFFLSTEKHWNTDSEEILISSRSDKSGLKWGQYFQIDTKQLNACLGTIPLYERNCYPSAIFSKQEIDSMKLKAQYKLEKYKELGQRLKSSKKMEGNNPKLPVKCLLGTDALPSQVEHKRSNSPVRPTPCLIGPMALPQELRNDPNVTESHAAPETVLLRSMNITEMESTSTKETVPIGSSIDQPHGSTSEEKLKEENSSVKDDMKPVVRDTKEDIQQWLDDILEM